MSSDDYYIVRPDPQGYRHGWYAIWRSASDDQPPEIRPDTDAWFATKMEAVDWALNQSSEYGLRS